MNSTTTKNRTTFHYNSDLSGDVIINRNDQSIHVPGEDLIELVTNFVRNEVIAQLEQLETEDLLNLLRVRLLMR